MIVGASTCFSQTRPWRPALFIAVLLALLTLSIPSVSAAPCLTVLNRHDDSKIIDCGVTVPKMINPINIFDILVDHKTLSLNLAIGYHNSPATSSDPAPADPTINYRLGYVQSPVANLTVSVSPSESFSGTFSPDANNMVWTNVRVSDRISLHL